MMTTQELLLRIGISGWLLGLAIQDIRNGLVSNWLTIPPLLAVILWKAFLGKWVLLIAFAVVLFVSEFPGFWPVNLALLSLVSQMVSQDVAPTVAMWVGSEILWSLGVLGGADVKAVMFLSTLFPDFKLGLLLALFWWVESLIVFVRKYGKQSLRMFIVVLSSFPHFLRNQEDATRAPALPSIALAGLVFLWFYSPNLL